MRTATLARAPQDVERFDASRFEVDRATARALDKVYFRLPVEPGAVPTFGAVVVDALTYSSPVMDLPAGALSGFRRTSVLHDMWPKTVAVLSLWYTSPVGSTATFNLVFNGRQIGVGLNLTGYAVAFSSGTFAIPGPAVANDVLKTTFIAPAALLSSPELVAFTLARLGPDANANALRIVFGEIVLREVA